MDDEQLVQIRAIIVGIFAVGKTSLIHRWISDSFSEAYVPTIGADHKSKKVRNYEQQEVMLNVWDTSGDEKFSEIAAVFYNNANVVIICFDYNNDESKEKIDYFISNAHTRSINCAIFLVATKIDQFKESNDKINEINDYLKCKIENLQKEYPEHLFSSFTTSSKTGEGIDDLFNQAANMAPKSDLVQIDISVNTGDKNKSGCC